MTPETMTNDEIVELAELYRNDVLGLQQWDVTYMTNCILETDNDNSAMRGNASCDPRYFSAAIQFAEGIAGDKGKVTVIHEVLHILFAEMDFAFYNHIVGELVPKKRRQLAYSLYKYHEERIIEHLARRLAELSTRV